MWSDLVGAMPISVKYPLVINLHIVSKSSRHKHGGSINSARVMMDRRSFLALLAAPALPAASRQTAVSVHGGLFMINNKPTYQGRQFKGMRIEGLLMNSRMVQGIFDDLNSETRSRWAYPDTKKWDPDRNTREFVAAMPLWRSFGLLAFTINLQGGSPEGYSRVQPWHNSAFRADGSLRPDYMGRLESILDRADELGMVSIVGLFYAGQDQRLEDDEAVKAGVRNAIEWLGGKGYRNILIEVANECDNRGFDRDIIKAPRIHELIVMAKSIRSGGGRYLAGASFDGNLGQRYLVGASFNGNRIPTANVVQASDFLLLHGNGVTDPNRITEMVEQTRKVEGYRTMPILFNEDDHFDFDKPVNNMMKAVGAYASWGYFDPYADGYQTVPVNWGINTERKRAFFNLVKEVTGS